LKADLGAIRWKILAATRQPDLFADAPVAQLDWRNLLRRRAPILEWTQQPARHGRCGSPHARFLGFGRLEKLAHAGESLLSRLRDGKLALNAEFTRFCSSRTPCRMPVFKQCRSA
jgi:hypothetical protein